MYIAYDNDHIYFGFYAHYADPSIMRANRVDRDQAFQDDLVSVFFDPFLDQQRAYVFDVNGYGVQGDGIINAGGSGGGGPGRGGRGGRGGGGGGGGSQTGVPQADRSWDALFESGAQIVDDGYTVEMAIPFKSLRYPRRSDGAPHRWGFQIVREIKGKNEENVVWAPMSRDVQSFMAQMGVLDGMTGLSTSRNLEILPTFTGIKFGAVDGTGDFVDHDLAPEAGLNVKYGITSNLTADLALNPDFSQIESDRPQVTVNQRFPLFFEELRPFFLEGKEIFNFTSPITFMHTRTIIDPNYGGKLTGKVGRATVGVIVADDNAPGRRDEADDPAFGQTAKFFIGRARWDMFAESHIGVLVTDREFMDSYSRVGGVDAQIRLSATDRFNFIGFQSQHRDEEGNERSGPVLGVAYRHDGRNLSLISFYGSTHPDFRTDVGFVQRVDQKRIMQRVSYRWWPQHWLINWGPQVNYERSYNFDNVLEDEVAGAGLQFSFARSIGAGISAERSLERFGGVDFRKWRGSANFNINTSRVVSFGGGLGWGDQIFYDPTTPYLGRGVGGGAGVTFRPVSRLQARLDFSASNFTDVRAGGGEVFDVKLYRVLTTYQFTERLLFRNITEHDTFAKTLGLNFLLTYRVNAGTVFYLGYDDHYQQEDRIDFDDDERGFLMPTDTLRQTNRAIFTKLQYLFRF